MSFAPILVAGSWQTSKATSSFQAVNPKTTEPLPTLFPLSPWADLEPTLAAATIAFDQFRQLPDSIRADFLEKYASRIEGARKELVEAAALETGLPAEPRLNGNELPRTADQLRQAASSVRNGDWAL